MRLFIDRSSHLPPYLQLKKVIKDDILAGRLSENEALPSVRHIANTTGLSVATVQRTINELNQEGFVYSESGKGCYVASRSKPAMKKICVLTLTGLPGLAVSMSTKQTQPSASLICQPDLWSNVRTNVPSIKTGPRP